MQKPSMSRLSFNLLAPMIAPDVQAPPAADVLQAIKNLEDVLLFCGWSREQAAHDSKLPRRDPELDLAVRKRREERRLRAEGYSRAEAIRMVAETFRGEP